ncbi:MAG: hypothetical protein AAGA08_11550 [Pseudomonadota bacterium]
MFALIQSQVPMADLHLILQITGVLGFLSYMGGFAALQLGKLDGNGIGYVLTNIIGATLVLISLIGAFNLASLLIQVSWIVIGCCGILRHLKSKRADAGHAPPQNRTTAPTPLR